MRRSIIEWQAPDTVPEVPAGNLAYFMVAVVNPAGRTTILTAPYLNAYPLVFEDGCSRCAAVGEANCPQVDGDGCPTTGWHTSEFDPEYDQTFNNLLTGGMAMLGWAHKPKWEDAQDA
jgi:hypothetical protein